MSHAEIVSRRLWSDWFFERMPLPEWPIDLPTLGRFAAYVVLPLLGWVGAALVQHVLESALR